ncbi:hypothetical protein J1N35_023892 [Gossypium stocksii]|uniref:Legume lectin domain-containing protein n=1 Tax=Gossypium stocksii TaxID=47602 RepID=A0A9D3VJR5_9ROSI|nr:hypothetical protein J1N35_023892 [Gossypium stocksii]
MKSMVVNCDGKFLVSLGSGLCTIWDVTSSKFVASLAKGNDEVFAFCRFSQINDKNPHLYIAAVTGTKAPPRKKVAAAPASKANCNDINQGQFSSSGYLNVEGVAGVDSSGLFKLTNTTSRMSGQSVYKNLIQFKNSTNATVSSFSTTFNFAIVPEYTHLGGHGLAFVISPNDEISGALPTQYLSLFNATNIGLDSKRIVVIELDKVRDFLVGDIDNNHVGININSSLSVTFASAGYFTDEGEFKNLNLKSGDPN